MKNVIKIIKKIILFLLIIILPINSFAAVSVSDGSAFVSKSEFSSTINNLSNRMSHIENTLDAKIDSLVSSYLSRNGIWNGEKQTLSSYKSITNVVSTQHLYNAYRSGRSANLNNIVDGKESGSYELIKTISKSGLAHVVFNVTGQGVGIVEYRLNSTNKFSGQTLSNAAFTDHQYFRDFIRYKGSFELRLYINGNQVYSNEVIGCSTGMEEALYNLPTTGTIFHSANWTAYWVPKRMDAYFFVNKGDVLNWNIMYTAVYGEIFTNNTGSNGAVVGGVRGSNFGFNISQIEIY